MIITLIIYFLYYDEIIHYADKMFTLASADALDYAAVFEDAAEELHILGKLVPPHYQYTESSDEVCFFNTFSKN